MLSRSAVETLSDLVDLSIPTPKWAHWIHKGELFEAINLGIFVLPSGNVKVAIENGNF